MRGTWISSTVKTLKDEDQLHHASMKDFRDEE
jgi:hypothetical protein